MPDFEAKKWAPAGGLGDLAAVGTDLASANAMLETQVTMVRDVMREQIREDRYIPDWPVRYKVELTDVRTGKVYRVYTNRIVVASGIGKPVIPIQDPATLRFIEQDAQRVADALANNPKLDALDPSIAPRVQTFTDLVNRIGQSENPFRWAVDKDIAVVGGGDSGKVINEFFFRDAPDGAYGLDTASVGEVRRVYWIGVSFEDCQQFIAQSRGRYSRLQSALNSGRLVPVPGRVGAILDYTGRLLIRTQDSPFYPAASDRFFFARNDATDKVPGRSPFGSQSSYVVPALVDHVVVATGFESESETVFRQIIGDLPNGKALKPLLEDVLGNPDGFDGQTAVATRLMNNVEGVITQEIYFIGPSNEVKGGLPKPDELKGINANTVSLFANVARTRELARLDAERKVLGLPSLEEKLGVKKVVELYRSSEAGTAREGAVISRANPGAPKAKLSAIADIELKEQVAKMMQGVGAPEGVSLTVRVTKAGEDKLRISVAELDEASEKAFAQQLLADSGRIAEMLFSYFARPSNIKELKIVLPPTTASGDVRASGIDVQRSVN